MLRHLALILVGALIAACGGGSDTPELDDFWYVDLERATEAATAGGKPMLVVFR